MSPPVTKEKGFSLISLSQPTACCHGNREPVEGVNCITAVRQIHFHVTAFADFELVHRQKCVCVLVWCVRINVTGTLLRLFLAECLSMRERKKRLTSGGGRTWVRMNEGKIHKMLLSPWLQKFNVFLNKPSLICADCVSDWTDPAPDEVA